MDLGERVISPVFFVWLSGCDNRKVKQINAEKPRIKTETHIGMQKHNKCVPSSG